MTLDKEQLLKDYHLRLQEIFQLDCIGALLDWDQQVNLPAKGAQSRAEQLELMSLLAHNRQTCKEFQGLVNALGDQLDTLSSDDQVNVRESKYQLEKSLKLPETFIAQKSRARSAAYVAWIKARKANDFALVKDELQTNISLSRQEANYLGYEETPYDALLDNYEPGSKLSIIKGPLFALADELKEILPGVLKATKSAPPFGNHFEIPQQKALNERVARDLGYDFEGGRMDIAPHPFMTTLGAHDKRITTRYDQSDYLSSLLTAIHEVGHALYEQGLPSEHAGTPRGNTISLSIHESQSRIWENIVGRSKPFAKYLLGLLGEYFPEEAARASVDHIWHRLNSVRPSLIRVEADEVTYSLHVVIRMILEEEVINQGLDVEELPTRWNELYQQYLEVEVPDDANGVLQDVHWYGVGMGYFPTYALGNLYSTIMMEKITENVTEIDQKVSNGNFVEILAWLRKNVHQIGMTLRGPELAEKISGDKLSHAPFIKYIKGKFEL